MRVIWYSLLSALLLMILSQPNTSDSQSWTPDWTIPVEMYALTDTMKFVFRLFANWRISV